MARPEWIEVGRISRAHGVRGEVRVLSSSDNPERFVSGAVLFCRADRVGIAGPRTPERGRLTIAGVRGESAFPIVAFREVSDRSAAEALRGRVLEVRSTELPNLGEGEYYPFDLIGLTVLDTAGRVRGLVGDAVDTPAHSLLVVRLHDEAGGGEGVAEVFVPFVREAVPRIELRDGYLVVEPTFL